MCFPNSYYASSIGEISALSLRHLYASLLTVIFEVNWSYKNLNACLEVYFWGEKVFSFILTAVGLINFSNFFNCIFLIFKHFLK